MHKYIHTSIYTQVYIHTHHMGIELLYSSIHTICTYTPKVEDDKNDGEDNQAIWADTQPNTPRGKIFCAGEPLTLIYIYIYTHTTQG